MKIKTMLFLFFVIVIIFYIYICTVDKKINYLNLSNYYSSYSDELIDYLKGKNKFEKYVSGFVGENDRLTDIINKIEDNQSIYVNNKEQTIQNALIKTDLLILDVGINDIRYKIGYGDIYELYEYTNNFLIDYDKLLSIIRKYSKEKIIVLGFYNIYGEYFHEYFGYLNMKIEELCKEYKINFININNIYKIENHKFEYNLNNLENEQIFVKIKNILGNS